MTPTEAYADLKKRMIEVETLLSTSYVLEWDQQTYMPDKGDDHRGEQLAQLSRLVHEWATDPKVGDLLSELEQSDLVSDPEGEVAVNVREWRRLYDRDTKLPTELVEEFARATSKGIQVWSEARKKSDFSMFQPELERIIELCRRKADYIGFEKERYEALLDEFEPRAKVTEVEDVFAKLRPDLTELIGKVQDAPRKPDIGALHRPFNIEKQRIFCESVGSAMGYDFNAGRFDEAEHPSCNGLGPCDVRVLTRYFPKDFSEGLTGGMHEVGHAMYDMTKSKEHWGTPMYETASLGIHESQSRMWENMVGRSRQFWQYYFPQLKRLFRDEIEDVDLDGIYGAMNYVAPSYIRVSADEATYNLHIILRFDIERAIIAGDIAVKDIPGEWNERFKKYLGMEVDNDANGCLQDVHWSHGIFGYFPTYALGNLYAAQFWAQAQEDIPPLMDEFKVGEFGSLAEWLHDKIHVHGSRWDAPVLCEKVTGAPLSHQPLLDYLYEKYAEVYGISR